MFDLPNRSFLTRATLVPSELGFLATALRAEQRQVCGSSATTTELCPV